MTSRFYAAIMSMEDEQPAARVQAMHCFRVTKYNPAHRDERGRYLRDDWITFSQVGSECGGVLLTLEDYELVERAYIDSALQFLTDSGIDALTVHTLENRSACPTAPAEGDRLDLAAAAIVMRSILRGQYWCRLAATAGYVHFGWDYYMYVGVCDPCESACEAARVRGLYVERFASPYHEDAN